MIFHLVRHPPVTKAWQKRCYGQRDPGLSREGKTMIAPLVDRLAALKPDIIIHSDMARTRAIAEPLARRLGMACIPEPLWRERDFGDWEGQSWAAIYRATGNAMDGMMNDPEHFRPGGGETTRALLNRIKHATETLPEAGTAIIIAHGGPIACARLTLGNFDFGRLTALIPKTGEVISVTSSL